MLFFQKETKNKSDMNLIFTSFHNNPFLGVHLYNYLSIIQSKIFLILYETLDFIFIPLYTLY